MSNNIEFSSVQITKALDEACKGCAEIMEISDQDFIHMILARSIGEIISKHFEYIILRGKSVEDDVELLRKYISIRNDGGKVILINSGNSWNFKNISKAMDIVKDELAALDKEDMGKFDLLFKNAQYEQERRLIGDQMISDDLTIENPEDVKEKQEKFRQDKGYLISEIPPNLSFGGIYAGLGDPSSMLLVQELIGMAQSIKEGNFDPKDIIIFVLYLKTQEDNIRRSIKKFLGSEASKEVIKIVKKHLQDGIDDLLNEDEEVEDEEIEDEEIEDEEIEKE